MFEYSLRNMPIESQMYIFGYNDIFEYCITLFQYSYFGVFLEYSHGDRKYKMCMMIPIENIIIS